MVGFTEFVDIAANQGVGFLIGSAAVYLGFRYFNKKISGKAPYKNLSQHPIFTTLAIWIDHKIENIQIDCPFRSIVFKDFLKFKFISVKKELAKLTDIPNIEKLSNTELENILLSNLYDVIKDYERSALDEGIPKIFVTTFGKWHQDRIVYIEQTIKYICKSNFISDNTERVACVLDAYMTALNMTLVDGEKTLTQLNGQINSANYKQFKCFKCKKCYTHPKKLH